ARRTHAAVERADERLTTRLDRLRSAPTRVLVDGRRHLDRSSERLTVHPARQLAAEERSLESAAGHLALLDPANLLRRGWSITRDADGRVVRSTAQVEVGAVITTRVADGDITSRIEEP
ncbi:MAG: exodeoxyribonuclease VII large subunit, partial [Ilumatobacteraceae bacterium]